MGSNKFRTEKDSMGELQVPGNALYGAQTQRAVNNFAISGLTMPREFIKALGLIKAACALANCELNLLEQKTADAIVGAARRVAGGELDDHFPVDVFQTGSGTSSNMNVNEVIAHLAGDSVHPNDHVNMGQSSNDVIPTAIHVSACIAIHEDLLPALNHFAQGLRTKAGQVDKYVKTGRTHLMDAMPVTLGQELNAWATQIENGQVRIQSALKFLHQLAQGGTAVGTGINAHPDFAVKVAERLSTLSTIPFTTKPDKFEGLSAQDAAVEMSGQLKTLAVSMMKIANDLRWMNCGPLAGLGEIALPALQPGSSIMPGKVNPVIPEAAAMVCAQVIGNDTTITVAGQAGNFQLNVMLPVIAYNLIQSIRLLANSARLMADKAIAGFTVNESALTGALSRNPVLVTALNNVIGYEKGAAVARRAYAEGLTVIESALALTDLSEQDLVRLLDPARLTKGGIQGL